MRNRVLLVITADQLDAANKAAVAAAGPYADGTFSVPFVSGDAKETTHYAASWSMTGEQEKAFKAAMDAQIKTAAVSVYKDSAAEKVSAVEKIAALKLAPKPIKPIPIEPGPIDPKPIEPKIGK